VVAPGTRSRLGGSGSAPTDSEPGRVVLFDKDGTLIEDVPYNVDPALMRLPPGAGPALQRLAAAGYGAAVVTNQSGVALGRFSLRDLDAVRDRLAQLLAAEGVPLLGFYACPHLPTGSVPAFAVACACHKPRDGLLRQAIADLGLETGSTWMVGDSWADVAAGRSCGCRTLLVGPEARSAATLPPAHRPELAAPDLATGIDALLAAEAEPRPGGRGV
jgi:histidinol-phosphate phosphatase family protein